MPLYMDVHHKIDGLTAEAIKGAHEQDVKVQKKHGVTYTSIGSIRAQERPSVWWRLQQGSRQCGAPRSARVGRR